MTPSTENVTLSSVLLFVVSSIFTGLSVFHTLVKTRELHDALKSL